MTTLALLACLAAALPAILIVLNLMVFRRPGRLLRPLPSVSILVPARNEEKSIGRLLASLQSQSHTAWECRVLDDQSTDGTAAIIQAASDSDPRIQLQTGQGPPTGWAGKQFACWTLAQSAQYDELLFLDADVTLAPGGLAAILSFRQQ
ncbi:MAG: glycosyltransferase family 2 protein, partial [Gemmataceae bacterium]